MRIKDFEKAIDGLCIQGLVIDEVKMKADGGGHVLQVNGHATVTVVWDELGRGFTVPQEEESEEFVEIDSGKAVTGRRLKRDTVFDLKFD